MYSWSSFSPTAVLDRLQTIPFALRPRPNSGTLWLDILWIILLAGFQLSVLPSFFGAYFSLDFLTSWVVVSMIRQTLWRSAVLAAFAALILETHTTLPVGTYFCIYAVILCVIANLKDPFSWMHRMPWVVSIALANIWAVLFEVLLLSILNEGISYFGFWEFFSYAVRLLMAVPFGLLLAQREIRVMMLL